MRRSAGVRKVPTWRTPAFSSRVAVRTRPSNALVDAVVGVGGAGVPSHRPDPWRDLGRQRRRPDSSRGAGRRRERHLLVADRQVGALDDRLHRREHRVEVEALLEPTAYGVLVRARPHGVVPEQVAAHQHGDLAVWVSVAVAFLTAVGLRILARDHGREVGRGCGHGVGPGAADGVTVIASRASRSRTGSGRASSVAARARVRNTPSTPIRASVRTRPPSWRARTPSVGVERIVPWRPSQVLSDPTREQARWRGWPRRPPGEPLDVLVVGGGDRRHGRGPRRRLPRAQRRPARAARPRQRYVVPVEQARARRAALPGDVRLRAGPRGAGGARPAADPARAAPGAARSRSSTRCTARSSGPTSAPGSPCTTRWRWSGSTRWACPGTGTCSASRSPGSRPTCAPDRLTRRHPLLRLPGRRRAPGGDPRPHRRPPRRPGRDPDPGHRLPARGRSGRRRPRDRPGVRLGARGAGSGRRERGRRLDRRRRAAARRPAVAGRRGQQGDPPRGAARPDPLRVRLHHHAPRSPCSS